MVFGAAVLVFSEAVAQGTSPSDRRVAFNAKGRMLPWFLPIDYPWVGGNYYQLEEISRAMDNDAIRAVLESMRDATRDKDAALLHADDLLHHARHREVRYTDVVIVATPGDLGPQFTEDEVKAWRFTSRLLVLPGLPPGAKVSFQKPQRVVFVGGLRSYSGVFTIRGTNEGDRCQVIIIVPLGSRGSHMFVLNVAEPRWRERFEELARMLERMSYEPGLLKDAARGGK